MVDTADPAIRLRGVGKSYSFDRGVAARLLEMVGARTPEAARWALRDLDLDVPRGAVFGIVGRNGAGKSTLLRLVAGRLRPTAGTVDVRGQVSCVLELGTGLNPNLTGRQNARVNALFLGLDPWRIEAQLDQVLEFAELGDYADEPLHTYSAGMRARLAFSVLTAISPEILIVDEALATGDAAFAAKCRRFIRAMCRSGCTAMLVSHDTMFMVEACDVVAWIDHGRLRELGPSARVCRSYLDHTEQPTALGARPRSVLLRLSSPAAAHWLSGLRWGSGDERVTEVDLTDDEVFGRLVATGPDLGLTLERARSGWKELGTPGADGRPCRRLELHGGAAFLALPIPAAPAPLPTHLTLAGYGQEREGLKVELFLDGEYRAIGAFPPGPGWKSETLAVAWARE